RQRARFVVDIGRVVEADAPANHLLLHSTPSSAPLASRPTLYRPSQRPHAGRSVGRLEVGMALLVDHREAALLVRSLGRIVADQHANVRGRSTLLAAGVQDLAHQPLDQSLTA